MQSEIDQVLQIYLTRLLNFTLVVAFCTFSRSISQNFAPQIKGLFRYFHILAFCIYKISILGGHAIPAGTTIMPNLMALHMNKEAWGDPEAFRPERFLDKDGKMGPHISSWMPFSSGRRVCVGEALAKANLIMVMASLIQRYEFSAPAGMMMNLRPKDVAQFTIPDDNELVIKRRK